eukprot:949780-Amorphochlora_amoeboformis.AAC.1
MGQSRDCTRGNRQESYGLLVRIFQNFREYSRRLFVRLYEYVNMGQSRGCTHRKSTGKLWLAGENFPEFPRIF